MMKKLSILAVLVLVFVVSFASVDASSNPYLTITNGDVVVVPDGQSMEIVVQFGTGDREVINAAVHCRTSRGVRLTGEATGHEPFDSWYIGEQLHVIHYPNLDFQQRVDLAPGQNYNVAFDIEASHDGYVHCRLTSGDGVRNYAYDRVRVDAQ